MRQFTNTYRITISDKMKEKLELLKFKYSITPTSFIRLAIEEKIEKDMPKLKTRQQKIKIPF